MVLVVVVLVVIWMRSTRRLWRQLVRRPVAVLVAVQRVGRPLVLVVLMLVVGQGPHHRRDITAPQHQ